MLTTWQLFESFLGIAAVPMKSFAICRILGYHNVMKQVYVKILFGMIAISLSYFEAEAQTKSIGLNPTSFASAGTGVVFPSTTSFSSSSTLAASAVAGSHPSSGSASVTGTWRFFVTNVGSSSLPPDISGYFQWGFTEESAAYAHNNQSGASASGSSDTLNTSNTAAVGVGTDNPLDDYYYSATPDPTVNIPTGAKMSGSGSSWSYGQDLIGMEAHAEGYLTGTPPPGHDTGSGSASAYASLSYAYVVVVTH